MVVQTELQVYSPDWGESNWNPMVRAWGLKRDRKAKCKSCTSFLDGRCVFRKPHDHSADYHACTRYQSKRRKGNIK